MKQSLYNIEQKYLDIMSEIEEAEGEVTEENLALLSINESERDGKSIAYLSVIKNKEAENALIDEEVKRLQAIKKSNNSTVDRLKDNLLTAVKLFGNYEVGFSKFGVRKSKRLDILDETKIPEVLMVTKTTTAPDKKEITKAIKNGVFVDGVELVEYSNLKIN